MTTPAPMPDPASPRARKQLLLRLEPSLFATLESWAAQELRSVNAQIEWILTEAARRRGAERRRQTGDG